MNIVADTGPLIALAKLRQLRLLSALADQVLIPTYVQWELLAKVGAETHELQHGLEQLLAVKPAPAPQGTQRAALAHLDEGERQAILLALTAPTETILLMDDQAGRTAARRWQLSVTGVVGILVRAKECKLIPKVIPLLRRLQREGYWLSEETIETARQLAGE
jgi:predicted nucleic acid-binding protein